MATARERLEFLRAKHVQPQGQDAPAETDRQKLERLRAQSVLAQEPLNPVLTPEQAQQFTTEQQTALAERAKLPIVEGESRAVRELPEIGVGGFTLFDGEPVQQRSKAKLATMFTGNPRELANILESLSPNIGITQTPEGDLIANNNETGKQVLLNNPKLSGLDAIQALGLMTAFTPAAAVANIPKQLGFKALVGAAASGATQTGIEVIQSQLGGEMNAEEVAIASALGGAAELVVPAIQAFRNARKASKSVSEGVDLKAAKENIQIGKEASEATKIRQFPAQQTLNKADLEAQSFLPELPASTQKASQQLKAQNAEAFKAVDDFLKQIAPDESIVTGGGKFRTAAQNAVDKQKTIRSERASPIYKDAFKSKSKVDITPVRDLIDSGLSEFPKGGQVSNSLKKIKGFLVREDKAKPTLKQLHNAKLEIDTMINGVGESSLGNTTKSQLTDVKNLLLKQMDEGSSLYKQAREEFAKLSPNVDAIKESIIGKVSKLNDTQLKDISARIFNPAETNHQVIKQAKKVIDDIDPDAWNQLLRVELEKRLGKAKTSNDPGIIDNTPSKLLNAIFGNNKQKKVLFNAIDGDAKKNLKFLEVALKRASLGRPGGSQTAGREAFKSSLDRGVVKSITNFIRSPIKSAGEIGSEASINRKLKALSETLFNPDFKAEMAKIRKLSPDSPEAARAMSQLLRNVLQQEEPEQDKVKQTK